MERILVTGGAGFLGSHLIRHLLACGFARVATLDLLTYAGDLRRLANCEGDRRYCFIRADVTSPEQVGAALDSERPDAVVHLAAESHVTRGETDPAGFQRTNVEGTRVVLEASAAAGVERFVHVSTDEVYGPAPTGSFREEDKLPGDVQATSAYAKSKALADDLARSYGGRLQVVVVRPTNCFGPWQFPEKALARWITRALAGRRVPVWGDGLYVRQWLDASDLARAIGFILAEPDPEPAYNIGGAHSPDITNLAVARWLLGYLGLPEDRLEMTAYDRPDHDRRYCIDATRIRALGWEPSEVWGRLAAAVEWYRANPGWWKPLVSEAESIYAGRGA